MKYGRVWFELSGSASCVPMPLRWNGRPVAQPSRYFTGLPKILQYVHHPCPVTTAIRNTVRKPVDSTGVWSGRWLKTVGPVRVQNVVSSRM